MMKKLLLSLAFSAVLATSAFAAKVGDTVGVRFVCLAKQDAVDVIKADDSEKDEVIKQKLVSHACALAPVYVKVVLEKEYRIDSVWSVWKIKDQPIYIIGRGADTRDADEVR